MDPLLQNSGKAWILMSHQKNLLKDLLQKNAQANCHQSIAWSITSMCKPGVISVRLCNLVHNFAQYTPLTQ